VSFVIFVSNVIAATQEAYSIEELIVEPGSMQ